MTKKHKKKKHSGLWFGLGMLLYALVFLGAAGFGLKWLWGFMEAYEASRPYIAIDGYMEQLTREHIVDACADVMAQADPNIQSEEECRQILMDTLEEEITCARKASACTEDKQVFVLRSGKTVIGSFTIETGDPIDHDFRPWEFTAEEFDLSFLMGTGTVSITVPEGYDVFVNGAKLDESYIIATETEEFEVLEDYYEDYDLPVFTLHTYQAGPFLNREYEIEAKDADGNPFVYDDTYDKDALIHNCTEAEEAELEAFLEEFLDIYVIFAGCANDDRYTNYGKVIQYVVPGSNLAQRMREALDGMLYAQSRGDEVDSIEVHHYVRLAEGKYLADVTYKVNTIGTEGLVQTTTNCHIILVETDGKLLVESMVGY